MAMRWGRREWMYAATWRPAAVKRQVRQPVRYASSSALSSANELIADLKRQQLVQPISPRNFSFSGCGFLIPYQLGIAHALKELGYIQPSSRVAGASGGAIVALGVAMDADLLQLKEDAKAMAATANSSWGQLELGLRKLFYERFGHADVEALARRLTIATHQIWPKQQIMHSEEFHSLDDLCDALIASCFIPFYLARQASSKFRGEFHVDGGLVKLVPEVPDHVRVCAFHAHQLRRDDYELSPSLDPEFPYGIFELFRYSLFPPPDSVLEDLFDLGRKTAALWAEKESNAAIKK